MKWIIAVAYRANVSEEFEYDSLTEEEESVRYSNSISCTEPAAYLVYDTESTQVKAYSADVLTYAMVSGEIELANAKFKRKQYMSKYCNVDTYTLDNIRQWFNITPVPYKMPFSRYSRFDLATGRYQRLVPILIDVNPAVLIMPDAQTGAIRTVQCSMQELESRMNSDFYVANAITLGGKLQYGDMLRRYGKRDIEAVLPDLHKAAASLAGASFNFEATAQNIVLKELRFSTRQSVIVIPEGITILDEGCLSKIDCDTLVLPKSLRTIRKYVTGYGTGAYIGELVMQTPVTELGANAFCGVTFGKLELPEGITTISSGLFLGATCKTPLVLPSSVLYIGKGAFRRFTGEVILPEVGVLEIESEAFSGCTVHGIPRTLQQLHDYAFWRSSGLSSRDIANLPPTSVCRYGAEVFGNAVFADTEIMLPSGLETIPFGFMRSTNITAIGLPSGVFNVKTLAFARCADLENVVIGSTLSNIERGAFKDCNPFLRFGVLEQTPEALRAAQYIQSLEGRTYAWKMAARDMARAWRWRTNTIKAIPSLANATPRELYARYKLEKK